jgi:hypothetical protein
MAPPTERESFIPLRRCDLIDLLCGDKELNALERDQFRQFCQLVTSIYHFEYNQRLEELKSEYAPFDPDCDTRALHRLTAEEEQKRLNDLFRHFGWLLEKANFRHLSREDIEPSLRDSSAWGLRVDVDFSAFERIAIFARGDTVQTRTRQRLGKLYRAETCQVPIYQRLVLIQKLRPHHRLLPQADTESVYLKVFKDIPKLDIKMLLPSARVRMSLLDRGRISFPLLSGLTMAAWNILKDIGNLVQETFLSTGTLWGLALGGIGYGYKSYYGYQQTRQRYRLSLTQSLYFQNLYNNGGVLYSLLNEAEEQEFREAVLAYFFLWRRAGEQGLTSQELNAFIERYLETNLELKVAFEIGDAIAKLEKMRIVAKKGDRYTAVPLAKALKALNWIWNNYFHFDTAKVPKPPPS